MSDKPSIPERKYENSPFRIEEVALNAKKAVVMAPIMAKYSADLPK